ncbi:MAG: class I SAM-dependent methyltransferase [Candidatus Sumerlaeota bacterium]|nr:class I SAM-dependent methyltransferase [Candidatus Sumerlaeota bacterium]
MHLLQRLHDRLWKAVSSDKETAWILRLLERQRFPKRPRILDVGCGFGRTLKALQDRGYSALGVEINREILGLLRADGVACVSLEEFDALPPVEKEFQVVIINHVIEHFVPADLLAFLDHYVACLSRGGLLIVSSPLLSASFYNDFDHVKPYHPYGFCMIFGDETQQVQYRSRHRMELVDLWVRKGPVPAPLCKARLVRWRHLSHYERLLKVLVEGFSLAAGLAFRLSFGAIGGKTGWTAVFRKE